MQVKVIISLELSVYVAICLKTIPCRMRLEVNFQISKHGLKFVVSGSCTSKVSEDSRYYAPVLSFHFFLRHGMRNFVLEKQSVTHVTQLFWNYFF